MNLLTPAALEAAAIALCEADDHILAEVNMTAQPWHKLEPDEQNDYRNAFKAAFNAAIDRLIKDGRAFDNIPGWENEIIIKKVKP